MTGKSRRDKILKQIITDSYLLHNNEPINLTGVLHFEAVEEFARENDGYLAENYVSVNTIINGEEIYTSFYHDPLYDSINITSMSKEDNEKESKRIINKSMGRE